MRKAGFAGEAHPHRVIRVGAFALAGELAIAQEGLLVRLEIDIDRVLRDDAGEHGLVGLDEVAERQQRAADSAGNRRTYLREVEIELGGGQRRFGRMNVGAGLSQRGAARVVGVDRDRGGLDQRFRTLVLLLRELRRCAGAFELGHRAVIGGSVGTRIDHEQKVARLDHVALLEGDAVDIAADARTYVDRADGRDPPSEFVPLAHRFGHDLDGIDLGRRRRRGFRLGVAASSDYGGHDHHGNGGKTRTQRREQAMAVRHERPPDLQLH